MALMRRYSDTSGVRLVATPDEIKAFLEVAVPDMQESVSNPIGGGWTPEQEMARSDELGGLVLISRPRPDLESLSIAVLRAHVDRSAGSGSSQVLTGSGMLASRFLLAGDGDEDRRRRAEELRIALERYGTLRPDFMWDGDVATAVITEARKFAAAEAISVSVSTLLHNVLLPEGGLDVGDGVELVPLSFEDKRMIWKRLRSRQQAPFPQHQMGWDAVLRVRVDWSPGGDRVHQLAGLRTRHLLTALRLLRRGPVDSSVTWSEPDDGAAAFAGAQAGLNDLTWSMAPQVGTPVEIVASDAEAVRSLVARLSGRDDHLTAFVLRRFNLAYGRATAEDRLVDVWIGLEAMFGQASTQGEVVYRMALRIARFLEEEPSRRKRLRQKVSAYYGARSKVVHGNMDVAADEVTKIAESSEDLLRRALVRWLEPAAERDMEAIELG